ncbi:hypothetical protein Forpi1262_v014587 [Fusarium oxysporum f. sp. raphani]|uniref:DNA/RNA-binding domain-containing protein n=1 Tax=Fusarium oxysporum f. sp. raphani TaxID=96318 RepID=A0A8J5PLT2_FUSOX|nr:hypothetical protein Forpi1262_v014587 [Fusarium oxysporum f. sp. raphani]
MMVLLCETAPAFEDTWIECLGDLGRYRMAIENDDIRDREVWVGQLYYYTKSLCVPISFSSARASIMTLFNSMPSGGPTRLAPLDAAFVRVHGILFSGKPRDQLDETIETFIGLLDPFIKKSPKQWLENGYNTAISLACSLLGYGAESNVLMQAISKKPEETDVTVDGNTISEAVPDGTFDLALDFATKTIEKAFKHQGDIHTLPFVHCILVFMNHMTQYPAAISCLEDKVPWKYIAFMLNTLLESCEPRYEIQRHFYLPRKNQLPRPLPEDFAMRGLLYSEDYFPNDWFQNDNRDDDEMYFELPSASEERKNRIISLGCRIATSGKWLRWNEEARQFSVPEKYDITLEEEITI